jgi:hypothetical protein
MSSIPVLQQALDRVLDAEPWDPVAVERARTKLDIALKRARDDEAHAEALKLLQAEAALVAEKKAHEDELFQMRKTLRTHEITTQSVPHTRIPTPPPSVRRPGAQPGSTTNFQTPSPSLLGLEAELPQPVLAAGFDRLAIEEAPLLPRLIASFRADLTHQCKVPSGSGIHFTATTSGFL